MKHFEDIWNEAEELQKKGIPLDRIKNISIILDKCQQNLPSSHEEIEEFMSGLLFEIAGLSKDLDINVAAALMEAINSAKIDQYG